MKFVEKIKKKKKKQKKKEKENIYYLSSVFHQENAKVK